MTHQNEPITGAQHAFILKLMQAIGKPGFRLAKRMANVPVETTLLNLTKVQAQPTIGKMIYIKNRPNQFREALKQEAEGTTR